MQFEFFSGKEMEFMKVSQILNNNVALVQRGKNEIIVYSKGISFRKKVGQTIAEDEIEKTYVLDSSDMLEHFSYLLANTDEKIITLVNEVISYGEKSLNIKINDYLNLTLLDHVSYALIRASKGQFIKSPLAWDVKKYYADHFQVGKYALKLLKDQFDVEFPEDEAVSIALHFVNAQNEQTTLDDTIQAMKILRDMLSIIQYHYRIQLDENSLNYMRLVTHLQYFIQRIQSNSSYTDNDEALNSNIREMYPKAYACVLKIRRYVKDNFDFDLSIDEETYLMLHVQRVTNRTDSGGK